MFFNRDENDYDNHEEVESGPKDLLIAVGDYSVMYALVLTTGVLLLANKGFEWIHGISDKYRERIKSRIDAKKQRNKKSGETGSSPRDVVDDVIDFDGEGRKEVPPPEIKDESREDSNSDTPQDDKPEPSEPQSTGPTTIGDLIKQEMEDQAQMEKKAS